MSLGKWMGIGAGWFLAGPIGAIIGYYIGKSFFDGKNDGAQAYELSLLIFGFVIFSLLGLGCLFLVFESIRENKTLKSFIVSIPYLVIGLGCFYLAYGAISELI